MPNHLHLLIEITENGNKIAVTNFMANFKSLTTNLYTVGVKQGFYKPFNGQLWQKSYYDRVVRNEKEYKEIWTYIDNNVMKWTLDEYY